jgi:carbon monoxide dehydrogenase subunit G
MDLSNEFVVPAPLEEAWGLLTNVERIAPCIPGFELKEVAGDQYRGTMKVKVGAVSMSYDSSVRFVERDEGAHRVVMAAEGREQRGQGGVTATITSTLTPDGEGTRVHMVTDLTVTGRVAQFGRGILADVSNRLVGQFVKCLEQNVPAAGGAEGAAEAPAEGPSPQAATESPGVRRVHYEAAEPVDLLDVAGAPLLKRLGPLVVALALVVLLLRRLRD